MKVSFRKWDVVLLSYPFTDLSKVKVSPAVILRDQEMTGSFVHQRFGCRWPNMKMIRQAAIASGIVLTLCLTGQCTVLHRRSMDSMAKPSGATR